MTLGCRAFYQAFLDEVKKVGPPSYWASIYFKNREWTAKMLGTGVSREKDDYGIIGRIGQKYGYEIQAEWRKLDQIWYFDLPKPEGWDDAPWRNDVVIEHENNFANLEYTIFKFEEISAPLKVGIFYPDEEAAEDALKKCKEMIVKQVSSYPGGGYLIIFGFLNEEKKEVYWRGYEIDFKGNITELPH